METSKVGEHNHLVFQESILAGEYLTSRVLAQRNLQVTSPLGHPSRHFRTPKHRTTASQFERWRNLKTSTMRRYDGWGYILTPITTMLLPQSIQSLTAEGKGDVLLAFVHDVFSTILFIFSETWKQGFTIPYLDPLPGYLSLEIRRKKTTLRLRVESRRALDHDSRERRVPNYPRFAHNIYCQSCFYDPGCKYRIQGCMLSLASEDADADADAPCTRLQIWDLRGASPCLHRDRRECLQNTSSACYLRYEVT